MTERTGGIRMKGAFWRLLKKEIRQGAPAAVVIAAVVVAWHMFLYTRIGRWPVELVFGLGVLPIGFVPLWLLWRGFAVMRQEWIGNHMHLLLALPVPGWAVAASKAVVVMLEAAWFALIIGVGGAVLGFKVELIPAGVLDLRGSWGPYAVAVAGSLLTPFLWIVMTQLAYVAGRLTARLSWLVSALVFVLSGWFVLRLGTVLTPLLRWVPALPLTADVIVNGVVVKTGLALDWTPAVGTILGMGGLFWAVSTLLERDVEL